VANAELTAATLLEVVPVIVLAVLLTIAAEAKSTFPFSLEPVKISWGVRSFCDPTPIFPVLVALIIVTFPPFPDWRTL
jgi:hypothetical protein